MLAVDIGDFIYSVVRGLHAGKNSEMAAGISAPDHLQLEKPTKALYLAFDIRTHFYPSGEEKNKYKEASVSSSLHFLFHRIYGSTGFCSTYTFGAISTDCFARLDKVKDEFEFLSSHDSCWKDAARDFANRVEHEHYQIVANNAGFRNDPIPYSRLNWRTGFPMFSSKPTEFYQWVDVQIDRDPSDKHHYDKLVKVL